MQQKAALLTAVAAASPGPAAVLGSRGGGAATRGLKPVTPSSPSRARSPASCGTASPSRSWAPNRSARCWPAAVVRAREEGTGIGTGRPRQAAGRQHKSGSRHAVHWPPQRLEAAATRFLAAAHPPNNAAAPMSSHLRLDLLHAHKPGGHRAVDEGRVGAPAEGVGVHDRAAVHQAPRLLEGADDLLVGVLSEEGEATGKGRCEGRRRTRRRGGQTPSLKAPAGAPKVALRVRRAWHRHGLPSLSLAIRPPAPVLAVPASRTAACSVHSTVNGGSPP